ncbi:MAG: OmpA family protein [Gammaproteobacteria bacterium]|nr:OmpA family protein [Gammaproteobacteria bacterium]
MHERRHHLHAKSGKRDRWMVSYADFMTLLFGLFVVMYGFSISNDASYRTIPSTIAKAIQEQTQSKPAVEVPEVVPPIPPEDVLIKKMADSVQASVAPWIDNGLIQVKQTPAWLEIEINANRLFETGSAQPSAEAAPILKSLADALITFSNALHVEGYTDNLPISNNRYPSNWELSSARASQVVRMLISKGIDPNRLAAVGYGEYRPIAENTDEAGRMRNRRIVLRVLAAEDPHQYIMFQAKPNGSAPSVATP